VPLMLKRLMDFSAVLPGGAGRPQEREHPDVPTRSCAGNNTDPARERPCFPTMMPVSRRAAGRLDLTPAGPQKPAARANLRWLPIAPRSARHGLRATEIAKALRGRPDERLPDVGSWPLMDGPLSAAQSAHNGRTVPGTFNRASARKFHSHVFLPPIHCRSVPGVISSSPCL
jgi:hypothetical protein